MRHVFAWNLLAALCHRFFNGFRAKRIRNDADSFSQKLLNLRHCVHAGIVSDSANRDFFNSSGRMESKSSVWMNWPSVEAIAPK